MEKPYNNDKGTFKPCLSINDILFHSNPQTSLKGGAWFRKGGVWGQVVRMDCKSDLGSRWAGRTPLQNFIKIQHLKKRRVFTHIKYKTGDKR